ncbi:MULTISPECIES: type II toxin-antitoxin system RelE/ParE family toxin [unclassified Bartonella]|uniref:type II toxin-antitoxin system RelE/ParE family toxin n=1 Tax=unclassified Bartonella TaxID=2645622 RepID=UPI0035D11CC2
MQAKTAIIRCFNRLEQGNFGDFKPIRDGIHELRINICPSYRVYYAQSGKTVLLLLCGGSKKKHKRPISLVHVLAGVIGKTVKIKGVQK